VNISTEILQYNSTNVPNKKPLNNITVTSNQSCIVADRRLNYNSIKCGE